MWEKRFAKSQDACRKGSERIYSVHFGGFYILSRPSRLWSTSAMNHVDRACAIVHNMIIEHKQKEGETSTKTIASIATNAEVVAVKTSALFLNLYNQSEIIRSHAAR